MQLVPFQVGTITGVRELANIIIPVFNMIIKAMVDQDNKINEVGQIVQNNRSDIEYVRSECDIIYDRTEAINKSINHITQSLNEQAIKIVGLLEQIGNIATNSSSMAEQSAQLTQHINAQNILIGNTLKEKLDELLEEFIAKQGDYIEEVNRQMEEIRQRIMIHKAEIVKENIVALADIKIFISKALAEVVEQIEIKNRSLIIDFEPIKDYIKKLINDSKTHITELVQKNMNLMDERIRVLSHRNLKENQELKKIISDCKCNEEIIQAIDRIQLQKEKGGSTIQIMKQPLRLKGRIQNIKTK